MYKGQGLRQIGVLVSPWVRGAARLCFGNRADVNWECYCREVGKETLVVILVGKVRVSAIGTWLCAAIEV